jgi:hypothetical protein
MARKRPTDFGESPESFEDDPFKSLVGSALAVSNPLPEENYGPYSPFVFDEENIVHDSRSPAERRKSRANQDSGQDAGAPLGFSEPQTQADVKPESLPSGQPKKTTAELITIIKANPEALNIGDIDFSDSAQVDAVIAELKQAMQNRSGEMRYETVLPGDPEGRKPGIYDRTTGKLIQAYSDTSDLESQNADITTRLSSLANGRSEDYMSALAQMQAAQEAVTGGITEADTEAGYNRLDALSGSDYRDRMSALSGAVEKGMSGQEGLSPEEAALYKRSGDRAVASEMESAQRSLNSIRASTGSTMAFLAAADEVRSKIGDLRIQNEVSLLNAEMARKEKNYQNKAEQYFGLLEQGRISLADYEEGLRSERFNSFQATAATLSQIASRDSAEIQNLTELADVIYAQISAMEVKNKEAYQTWIDLANQEVAPIRNLLDAIMTQDALAASR